MILAMVNASSKQSLSSGFTFFYKFVFPAICIGIFGLGILAELGTDPINLVGTLLIFIVTCLIFYWLSFPLKTVEIDNEFLYVSNFKKTIQIPFSEIEGVFEAPFINLHPVWIRLKSNTEFGSLIIFLPYFHFGSLFKMSHPVVAKLNELSRLSVSA